MRLTRTTRLAVPIVVLALAGCGGAQVTVNEVPGGPVDLKTPGTGAGFAAVTPTATASATPTETPTVDPSTGAAPTATPQADTTTQDNTPQADPNGGLARAMAGGRVIGLCHLEDGMLRPERIL